MAQGINKNLDRTLPHEVLADMVGLQLEIDQKAAALQTLQAQYAGNF